MKEEKANLAHGSGWEEHEDYLIGDEEGLRNLINASQKAITSGEYSGPNLGEFLGVKKLDSTWFEENKYETSKWEMILFMLVFIVVIFLAIIGINTVINWF